MKTPCMIHSFQIDDLVGENEQLNVPGTDREWPNWRRRLQINVEDVLAVPHSTFILAKTELKLK